MLNQTLILDIGAGPATSTDDPLIFEKEVIYVDSFTKQHPITGEIQNKFTVTEPDIDHWVRMHSEQLSCGLDVKMPVGHNEDPLKTAAEVLELSKKTDHRNRVGLFAKFKFKSIELANQLKDTKVSIFSPVVYHHNGKMFSRPIRHIAFTENPIVPDLGPTVIAASADSSIPQGNVDMKMSELALQLGVKHADDLTDDGIAKAIVTAHKELQTKLEAATKQEPQKDPPKDTQASGEVLAQLSSLTRQNRKMQIDGLFSSGKITADQAKELQTKWCGETLSLSADTTSSFESIVQTLDKNQSLSLSGERSGGQGGTQSKKQGTVSPLVRQAREAAGKNS